MKKIHYRKELEKIQNEYKLEGKTIGLVPTMGALHQGHLELVKTAKDQCDLVVASVFVNPTQFNNPEDLENYPRMPEKDAALLESVGCDIMFFPSVEEVYTELISDPDVDLGELANVYEGKHRPGHFDGVLKVVHRLFCITSPDKAYFGLKDFQQCLVVEQLAKQEHPNIEIVCCPIVREQDGLAMSSRNLRLTQSERITAPILHEILEFVLSQKGKDSLQDLLSECREKLIHSGFKVEYLSVADATNLEEIQNWQDAEQYIVVTAAHLGSVRLIDNVKF